jgi:hypothetical protein
MKLIVHLWHKFYFEIHFEIQYTNALQENVEQIVSDVMFK